MEFSKGYDTITLGAESTRTNQELVDQYVLGDRQDKNLEAVLVFGYKQIVGIEAAGFARSTLYDRLDHMQIGYEVVTQRLRKYDPTCHGGIDNYIRRGLRTGMIDIMRPTLPTPKVVRQDARLYEETQRLLEDKGIISASSQEIASRAAEGDAKLAKRILLARGAILRTHHPDSLNELLEDYGFDYRSQAESIEDTVEYEAYIEFLKRCIAQLDNTNQYVVERYYIDGIHMVDIGIELGVSEVAVSKRIKKVQRTLRAQFESNDWV